MSIVLRTLKGSALTYEDMDRNLSQYFYSSSVHDSGTELRLHYTGSDNLDTIGEDYGPDRYHSVTIGAGGGGGSSLSVSYPTTGFITQDVTLLEFAGGATVTNPRSGVARIDITGGVGTTPGGSDGSIQFNNAGSFGGNTDLFYSSGNQRVGLGTVLPENKLHITGDRSNSATIRLATDGGTDSSSTAQITFFSGTTQLGYVGKSIAGPSTEASEIYLGATNKIKFDVKASTISTITDTGLGIFDIDPNRQLVVVGAGGIGVQKGGNRDTQSIIRPIENGVYTSKALGSAPESYGLMLSGPLTGENNAGGHVVVSLSENTGGSKAAGKSKNSFTIISSENENYTNANSVATFRSDGKVGINLEVDTNPSTTLHVNGQIKGGVKLNYTDPETTVDLAQYKVVKKSVALTQTITATNDLGSSGIEATLIIVGQENTDKTLSFDSTFKTTGTLLVQRLKIYTMTFVSDGSYWYETSRTSALA